MAGTELGLSLKSQLQPSIRKGGSSGPGSSPGSTDLKRSPGTCPLAQYGTAVAEFRGNPVSSLRTQKPYFLLCCLFMGVSWVSPSGPEEVSPVRQHSEFLPLPPPPPPKISADGPVQCRQQFPQHFSAMWVSRNHFLP